MRSLFALLIAFSATKLVVGQTIPSDRITDWSQAGFRGAEPDSNRFINIIGLGAANDGSAAIDAYILLAIDSLNGMYGTIYFPPGNYLVNSTLSLPDSIILKGAGADSTTLSFNLNGAPDDCIDVSRSQDEILNPFVKIILGGGKGSSTITVADASSFSPNTYAEIRQDNGSWDTQPASYAEKCVGQLVKVISVSNNTIQIEPALRIDFDTLLNAEMRPIHPATHIGIECMKITRLDSSTTYSVYNINFQFAVNCRVRGVESMQSVGAHIMIEQSKNIEVSGSFIHHSFGYDGSGTRGYGICLRQHASDCLIENNFFRFLRHAMMVKEGANGNVFGYNYSIEPNRSEPIPDFSGDISLHGHYPFLNLFEGNIVQNIIIDHFWGQSGPYNTFFRNRAELYGIGLIGNAPITANQNFVGNEITNPTPPYGNYLMSGTGHFEYGNNVKGTITPTGTSSLNDSSYYLTSKPAFWNSGKWNSIGIPDSIGTGSNPAKDRFISALSLTVCEIINDSIPTDTIPDTTHNSISLADDFSKRISFYPNPADNFIIIATDFREPVSAEITLLDFIGRIIYSGKSFINQPVTMNFTENMNSGLYLLRVVCRDELFTHRLIKSRVK